MKSVLLKSVPRKGGPTAEVSEVPLPHLHPGDVMVEMKACGLCGTDIEKMHGEYTNAMPVLGHEAVGVVVALGEGVAGMKEGDRVFPHHHVPCYQCYYCRHGSETMCADYRTSNLDPGGFSERFRVPAWIVNKGGVLILPPQVRDEEATMIEPVACCIRALSQCAAVACDSVLVVGAGPVGMSHALLLNSMKVRVMISDVSRPRLQFAEQAGVGSVFYAGETDIPSAVKNETAGRGADLAIVASGSQRALTQALKSVRRGGVVCLFGIPVVSTVFEGSISDLYNSNVSIIPSYGAVESDTAKALDVMARKAVEFGSLITHKFPLDKFDQAVEAAVSGQAMKVVLTP